ncbi:MAG: HEAT repeat domain-containing protein [Planctomycetota bacterium]|jgi:HEAT repeat protein
MIPKAMQWLRLVLFLSLGLALFAGNPAWAQGDARGLLDAGKQAFLEGDYETAVKKFEEVMRLKPTNQEALHLRERAGVEFLVEVLTKGGKFKNFADWLLSRAELYDEERKSNPELIKEIIDDLMSDDMRRYEWALQRLAFEVGEYAAQELTKMLGNEVDAKSRERAVIALSRMGSQVALPVIECLNSKNIRQKQGAIIVLGNLGDLRAVADLKRLYEDPKEPPEVKDIASAALRNLARREPGNLRPAREYYYNKALLYFQNHPAIIKNYDRNWLYWKWNEEKQEIQREKVPQWLYNFRLAEEACYDALDIDYTYTNIWPVLCLVNLAEYTESVLHLQDAPDAVKDKVKQIADVTFAGWVGGLMGGVQALYDALDIALYSHDAPVAVSVIHALKETANEWGIPKPGAAPPPRPGASTGKSGKAGPRPRTPGHPLLGPAGVPGAKLGSRRAWPLIEALTYPDKRVRYAAAVALVHIHNRSPLLRRNKFMGQDRVIEVLIEALGESGARAILVGSPDVETRNNVVGELVNLGYFAFGAENPTQAFKRALRFPSEDLIILDMDLANELIIHAAAGDVERKETIIDAIRADYRTKDVPILILCDENRLDRAKELFQQDARGFIATPPNFSEVKLQLTQIFAAFPLDDKAMATKISKEAAEAVESIDPYFSSFPLLPPIKGVGGGKKWRDLVAALMAVIERRPDEVRAPALRALGKMAPFESVPAIVRLLKNKEANLPAIRAVAARAMADILARTQAKKMPEEALSILIEGLRDKAPVVRAACGAALGISPIQAEERYKAFKKGRTNPR